MNGKQTDRSLYLLFLGLFAVNVGIAVYNMREQKKYREEMRDRHNNKK